jgi:hypothetical protein
MSLVELPLLLLARRTCILYSERCLIGVHRSVKTFGTHDFFSSPSNSTRWICDGPRHTRIADTPFQRRLLDWTALNAEHNLDQLIAHIRWLEIHQDCCVVGRPRRSYHTVDAYIMVDERRRKVGDDVARPRKTYSSKLEDKGHMVSVPYKSPWIPLS